MEIATLPVQQWKAYRDLRLRALKEDAEAFSSSYATATDLPEAHWKNRLDEARLGERGWLLFAREHEKLVGMIGAFVDEATPDTATIVSVYVPKEERGKGISAKMMQAILTMLSEGSRFKRAELAVNANQRAAASLYKKFGFKEIARQPATTGMGETVEQVVMERPLPVDGRERVPGRREGK